MTILQHGAPPAPTERSYDPEIKDMADYVHNYSVNSDLAVWLHWLSLCTQLIFGLNVKSIN
jgi:hypothetical protein